MSLPIDKKLVVAIASSALFDLKESDGVYRTQGVEAYRGYQRAHQDRPLGPGIAFPFIRRLLSLNSINPADPPVEIVLLSRNDPDTGLRVFNSTRHHGLDISRGAFLNGKSPHLYIDAFNACLFLSANPKDVDDALAAGHAAGLVLGSPFVDDLADKELRVAFDFDGVLADDEAEAVFNTTRDLQAFHLAEREKALVPHSAGPLNRLFRELANLQGRAAPSGSEKPAVRIAIITARNAPSHERVVTTLRDWGVRPDETFFLGGIEKRRILEVFRPHMFFDDQTAHLEAAHAFGAMVHVPFGVKNR